MDTTHNTNGAPEIVTLPGHFTKLRGFGRTLARAHSLTDGSWVGIVDGKHTELADEAAATTWINGVAADVLATIREGEGDVDGAEVRS